MDLGPDPIDHDELIQRYGRRLFVLAYHLTGKRTEAETLSRECLVRSLLAPDFPAADKEAGVFLHRGLISLWRERAGLPGPAVDGGPGARAALFRALSRLDPVSRAVLVLRVAGGLEYETIGKVLDMAPDVVYARLLQARGGLREGERALEASLFETMNLYLDGRLPPDRRGAFERRMQIDAALRERVEFHRGLALELHEEAPALPRDFITTLREQMAQSRETLLLVDQATAALGPEPAPGPAGPQPAARPAGRHLSARAALAGAAIVLILGVGLGLWISKRRADDRRGSDQPAAGASPASTPDEETIAALRSLGYLAPGEERSRKGTAAKTAPAPTRPPKPRGTTPLVAPRPSPAASRGVAPSASPAPTATPAAEAEVTWRVVTAGRPPEPGSDHRVIRTALEWTALFEGTGATPPEVAFDREMVVLVPAGLGIETVRASSDELVIECRRDQPSPGAVSGPEARAAPPAGEAAAVVVPVSDLPVRVVAR